MQLKKSRTGYALTAFGMQPLVPQTIVDGAIMDQAASSLRFGLGRFTTDDQIEYTIKAISETVLKLREMSPLWEMYKEGIDLNTIEWARH